MVDAGNAPLPVVSFKNVLEVRKGADFSPISRVHFVAKRSRAPQ